MMTGKWSRPQTIIQSSRLLMIVFHQSIWFCGGHWMMEICWWCVRPLRAWGKVLTLPIDFCCISECLRCYFLPWSLSMCRKKSLDRLYRWRKYQRKWRNWILLRNMKPIRIPWRSWIFWGSIWTSCRKSLSRRFLNWRLPIMNWKRISSEKSRLMRCERNSSPMYPMSSRRRSRWFRAMQRV